MSTGTIWIRRRDAAVSSAVRGATRLLAAVAMVAAGGRAASGATANAVTNVAPAQAWLAAWEKNITREARDRYCDKEMGEELGWLVSPFVSGFSYGYEATRDPQWIDRLVDWADAVIRRGVTEPDGYVGWPKVGATGTALTQHLYTDSELGEAMFLRPLVVTAGDILRNPALKAKYGPKAEAYLRLSEQTFEKWEKRGAWREVRNGGLSVVPPFGIDTNTGGWTAEYAQRATDGFSAPDNKQNLMACWFIAMYDVTKKPIYKDRAEKWWRVMRGRMNAGADGKTFVWNYWEPAGPWDYKADGSPKHWIGVHPNGGYYAIDVEGIVTAYEHGLVFSRADIDRLIATNRDFMWNRRTEGAAFKRIDGGAPDARWRNSPGVLWLALTPYDATLRRIFERNHDPASWGGLSSTPWYLARVAEGRMGGGKPSGTE